MSIPALLKGILFNNYFTALPPFVFRNTRLHCIALIHSQRPRPTFHASRAHICEYAYTFVIKLGSNGMHVLIYIGAQPGVLTALNRTDPVSAFHH